jgi:hypothetical protein
MKPVSTREKGKRIFTAFNTLCYVILSLSLIGIGLALIFSSLQQAWQAYVATDSSVIPNLLNAIGLLVISMAVLDSGKYLMEEEVLRDRELRDATEARQTLTKFLVIITIAVSLEAVVSISGIGHENPEMLLYPAILLLSAVTVVVGLGIYQKLSGSAETKDRHSP